MEKYGKIISWDAADAMMTMAAFVYTRELYEANIEPEVEDVNEYARKRFLEFCNAEGIEEVEEAV